MTQSADNGEWWHTLAACGGRGPLPEAVGTVRAAPLTMPKMQQATLGPCDECAPSFLYSPLPLVSHTPHSPRVGCTRPQASPYTV